MNHRPYPSTIRALAQLQRRPETPVCPSCGHEVSRHARENGTRICIPVRGLVTCQDCAFSWATAPALARLAAFGATLNGVVPDLVVFIGRQAGKTAITLQLERDALARGRHVHRASMIDGVHCLGGAPRCRTPRCNRTVRVGTVLQRVVQTCSGCPSQWNAWTTTGQYLYLRYRSGIGTVEAQPSEDINTWTWEPGTQLAMFNDDTGDGGIELEEFCARTGFVLSPTVELEQGPAPLHVLTIEGPQQDAGNGPTPETT